MNRESDTNDKQMVKIVNLELAGSQQHLGKRKEENILGGTLRRLQYSQF
jgi:hypothetical protein